MVRRRFFTFSCDVLSLGLVWWLFPYAESRDEALVVGISARAEVFPIGLARYIQ